MQTCLTYDLASKLQSRKLVLFEGRVASDLEAIFCRGSEWDSGAEHIFIFKVDTINQFPLETSLPAAPICVHLVSLEISRLKPVCVCMYVQATPRATFEEVDQHLTQLAALAESSLAGALQTTHGKILCVPLRCIHYAK